MMPSKSKLYKFLRRRAAHRPLLLDVNDLPSQGHEEVQKPKLHSNKAWNSEDDPKTDESIKQWRRGLLLSPQSSNIQSGLRAQVQPDTRHSALESMKEELYSLVMTHEECRRTGEKSRVRRQREKLIADIEKLETRQRRHERGLKMVRDVAEPAEPWTRLPEPIGASEKKQLKLAAERVRKGRLGLEKPRIPLKRHRNEDDAVLDGEERLRLGKRVDRKPAMDVTGHWISEIHTHYLCSREDMSMENMDREDMSACLIQGEKEDIKQESESEIFGSELVLRRSKLESSNDDWNGLEGTEWDWEHCKRSGE